jgi:hypothetical protein
MFMSNEMVMERRSNLVLPEGFVSMDEEEMMDVDGGVYISYDSLNVLCGSVISLGAGAVSAALIAGTSWLNLIPGGQIIWTLLGASSLIAGIYVISALSQGKGLDITLSYTKVWFIPVPTGLSFKVC